MTFEELKELVEEEDRQFVMHALIAEGVLFESTLSGGWGQVAMLIKLEAGNYEAIWDGTTGELISLEEA